MGQHLPHSYVPHLSFQCFGILVSPDVHYLGDDSVIAVTDSRDVPPEVAFSQFCQSYGRRWGASLWSERGSK